jgi:putative aminopeptidase FrvX
LSNEKRFQMFKELTEVGGVPGNEYAVKEIMKSYLQPVSEELVTDRLGSIVGKKTGKADGPRVLIAGHMDEVGFMVTRITDEGFIRFQPLGGWWGQVMLAQRVTIETGKGNIVGVIGSKPPHILPPEERKKTVEIKDMFIDIGVASKEEAVEAGIRPGDSIVPICPFTPMANPKYLMAKAWDNRVGCAVAIDVLNQLQGEDHPNIVYSGATVQEEVGLRGAQTLSNTINPDFAFAIDVTIGGDTPGVKTDDAPCKLGKGVAIGLYDASMVSNKRFVDFIVNVAKEMDIDVQFDAMPGGGTDAGKFHLNAQGVPSIALMIPSRYIHSHAAIIHEDDYDSTVKLIVETIKRLDSKLFEEFGG